MRRWGGVRGGREGSRGGGFLLHSRIDYLAMTEKGQKRKCQMKVELEAFFFCYLKEHPELQITLLIYHFTPLAC